jgi:predicted DNA-binding mobile mystery protein A
VVVAPQATSTCGLMLVGDINLWIEISINLSICSLMIPYVISTYGLMMLYVISTYGLIGFYDMRKFNDRARTKLDARLDQARSMLGLTPPHKGWIRALRDALGMSGGQLARRLGVSPQNVEQTEKSEVTGTIQLATLRKYAEALDTKLVYALVPNTSLDDLVKQRARQLAINALSRVSHTMRLEDQETSKTDLEIRIDDYIRNELNDRDLWSEA